MDTKPKPKATANHFIAFFITIFASILTGLFAVVVLPLTLLSFFTLSGIVVGRLFLGITIVSAVIAAFIAQRAYDISELSPLKTSVKLIAVIGFLPFIIEGSMLIAVGWWDPKTLKIISGVIVWLLVIGLIAYFSLKWPRLRKTDP